MTANDQVDRRHQVAAYLTVVRAVFLDRNALAVHREHPDLESPRWRESDEPRLALVEPYSSSPARRNATRFSGRASTFIGAPDGLTHLSATAPH